MPGPTCRPGLECPLGGAQSQLWETSIQSGLPRGPTATSRLSHACLPTAHGDLEGSGYWAAGLGRPGPRWPLLEVGAGPSWPRTGM